MLMEAEWVPLRGGAQGSIEKLSSVGVRHVASHDAPFQDTVRVFM